MANNKSRVLMIRDIVFIVFDCVYKYIHFNTQKLLFIVALNSFILNTICIYLITICIKTCILCKLKASHSIIQSLDRGLEILEIVADAKKPVSVNELAGILQIDRSSISRLANTLLGRGLLMHADGTREFVLGSGLWRLANQYPWIEFLTRLASASLKKLARDSGETAHIAIREGTKTIIVDNEMSNQPLSVSVNTGDEGLLHCTSVGKALIMDSSGTELELLFGGRKLTAMTRNTFTSIDELAADLEVSRKKGYTLDDQEYFDGIRCVAAPIRDHRNKILAAVGVSAPAGRLPDGLVVRMGRLVMEVAENIGKRLKANSNNYTNKEQGSIINPNY